MKAVRVQEYGSPEALVLGDVPTPTPAAREVRVRVRAVGLNYADLKVRGGHYPALGAPPFTPGFEAAGVVDAVGAEVTGLRVGMRVVAQLPTQGAYAEYAIASPDNVVEIPTSLGDAEAVALLIQGLTASLVLKIGGRLKEGETVFIPAAAGGVGSLAVQLARRLGAKTVIGGASSSEKRDVARRLGAHETVDYTRDGWSSDVREKTGGRGADVVLEMNGGTMADESLRALARGGRLVVFGADSVQGSGLRSEQVRALAYENQSYVGFSISTLPAETQREALLELLNAGAAGELKPLVGQRYPLGEAAQAHRAMEARSTQGKIILVP